MFLKVLPGQDPPFKNMHVAQFYEMVFFQPELVYPHPQTPSSGKIIVTYRPPEDERSRSIEIPLLPKFSDLGTLVVTMHSSPTSAYNMGPEYNDWFSSCFGYPVILAYLGDKRREVLGNMSPNAAGRQQQQQQQPPAHARGAGSWLSTLTSNIPYLSSNSAGVDRGISFADCAPYLIITEESWQNASKRLPDNETLDITKFRPNVVVKGSTEAFEEDYWAELAIGGSDGVNLVLTQNCARCASLNVDYATGKQHTGEAGKILGKLSKDRRVDPGAKWSPIFGRYGFLDTASEGSTMSVGDQVVVAKRNKERTSFGECHFEACLTEV